MEFENTQNLFSALTAAMPALNSTDKKYQADKIWLLESLLVFVMQLQNYNTQ